MILVFLSALILFFFLSPGILGKFPPKGDKLTLAIVHALVFSILFSLCYYLISSIKLREGQTCTKLVNSKIRADPSKCTSDKNCELIGPSDYRCRGKSSTSPPTTDPPKCGECKTRYQNNDKTFCMCAENNKCDIAMKEKDCTSVMKQTTPPAPSGCSACDGISAWDTDAKSYCLEKNCPSEPSQ